MRVKIKPTALATGLVLGAITAVVPTVSASAAPDKQPIKSTVMNVGKDTRQATKKLTLTNENRVKQPVVKLDHSVGTAVSVSTEIDCNTHQLSALIANTTETDVTPRVTFDNIAPDFEYAPTLKPGESASYIHAFSGVQTAVEVRAVVDNYTDATVRPRLLCNEPVSFRVEATSQSAVTGYLQNNSTLLPQTVLTRVGSGDIRTEVLAPGESRLIAMPFNGYPHQTNAYVTIAVAGGYESNYTVYLNRTLANPLPL